MRLVALGMCLVCLMASSTVTAVASGPSPTPRSVMVEMAGLQRVEMHDYGIAVSLPSDWEYAVAATANPDEWWDGEQLDEVQEIHDHVVAGGGLLLARPVSPFADDFCIIYDFTAKAARSPAWTSIADAAAQVEALRELQGVVEAGAIVLDLPAAPAVRIDTLWEGGLHASEFYLASGTRWLYLQCVAHVPPEGRWLPIAESFEFLAEEE